MYNTAGCQFPFLVSFIPEATYFFYKIALSVLEPTVRLLIYHGVCVDVATVYLAQNNTIDNITDTSPCRATLAPYPDLEDRVQEEAADYMIISKILMNVPAIILGFFCGGWSDIVGRRLPMFLTCAGSCLAVIFYMLSLVVGGAAIPFVLFATFVHSVFGRNSVITMAVHSSVTDLTTKEERTKRLGRLLAMNFLGQFCGSLLLGILLDRVKFLSILCVVFVLFALCCVFIAVFLPETVPTASPILSSPMALAESSKELCRLHHIKDSVLVVARPRLNQLRLYLIICLVCLCVNQTCKAGEVDVTMLFVRHRPLEWEKSEYGYLLAVNFAAIGMCLLFVLPVLSGRLAIRDTTIIIGVVCFKIVRLILMAFARHDWLVYVSTLLDSPIGMVISCLKSIISKITDESETGKAFAIQASIETASGMFGAMVFNSLYDLSFRHFLGTTFLVEAAVYVVLLGIAIWMWRTLDGHYKSEYGRFNSDEGNTMLQNSQNEDASSDLGDQSQQHGNLSVSNPMAVADQQATSFATTKMTSYGGTATSAATASTSSSSGGGTPQHWGHQASSQQQQQPSPSWQQPQQQPDQTAFSSIGAPPTAPQRNLQQRAGEAPPASIARPRPTSNLTRRGNNDDELGALSQFR